MVLNDLGGAHAKRRVCSIMTNDRVLFKRNTFGQSSTMSSGNKNIRMKKKGINTTCKSASDGTPLCINLIH